MILFKIPILTHWLELSASRDIIFESSSSAKNSATITMAILFFSAIIINECKNFFQMAPKSQLSNQALHFSYLAVDSVHWGKYFLQCKTLVLISSSLQVSDCSEWNYSVTRLPHFTLYKINNE